MAHTFTGEKLKIKYTNKKSENLKSISFAEGTKKRELKKILVANLIKLK